MTAMATPSRASRDSLIPYLDTNATSAADDVRTVLTYGLHTPPQSAHDTESRRPSFMDSWCDTPGFEAATYSSMSTPVHQVHQTKQDLMQSWSNLNSTTTLSACRRLDTPFIGGMFHDQTIQTSLADPCLPCTNWDQYTVTNPYAVGLQPEQLSNNDLTPAGNAGEAFTTQASCMGQSLESTTSPLRCTADGVDPVYERVRAAFQGVDIGFDFNAAQSVPHHGLPTNQLYPSPSLVVPSQLAPLDVLCHPPAAEYASPEANGESFLSETASFPNSSLGSFDLMDPPSPMDIYTDNSDNEDYVMLRSEQMIRAAKLQQRSTRSSPAALRRRASRRVRDQTQPWHSHERNGIEVHCTGTPFGLDERGNYNTSEFKKKRFCGGVLANGKKCGFSTSRHEHLTRHMKARMHSDIRDYWCPIIGCPKNTLGMTRSDNACDHFKKHLSPPQSKKRTSQVCWETLRAGLEETCDEKVAGRLIANLQRWIDAGMQTYGRKTKARKLVMSPMSPTSVMVGPPVPGSP